jgi:histidyl-tRNA synthetase
MGAANPEADAEIILLTDYLMRIVGLRNYAFKLGHVGIVRGILTQEKVDEKTQNAVLQLMDKKEYDKAFKLIKSKNCRINLKRLLDKSKGNTSEIMESAREQIEGYSDSAVALQNLKDILALTQEQGCPVTTVEPTFARGLEYYTGMIFEVYIPELGIALGGGGRYDRLVEVFGGEQTPAIGVAHGLDRIAMALQMQNFIPKKKEEPKVAVVPISTKMKSKAIAIAQALRNSGIPAELEVMGRKMNKALEDADRRQMEFAVIVGEREIANNCVVLKNLAKREQTVVAVSDLTMAIQTG